MSAWLLDLSAPMETLQDDFSTGTVPDSTKWTNVGPSASVFVSGGLLSIKSTGSYYVCQSRANYTIANSFLLAKVIPGTPSGGSGSQQTFMTVDLDANNFVGILRAGGNLMYQVRTAGTDVQTTIAPYNAQTMAWWRVRHDGVGFYFGYSYDGRTWTETARVTPSWSVSTTMRATFMVGQWDGADPQVTSTYDNVNLPPAASVTGTDTASGSDANSPAVVHASDPDTGTGTESSGSVTSPNNSVDTGSASESVAGRTVSSSDTAISADAEGSRRVSDADSGTSVEFANPAAGSNSYTSADTGTATEAQTRYQPGQYSKIPVPRIWSNGDELTAGRLNLEWRDTFNWLLRKTSPGFSGFNGDTSYTITSGTPIPITVEELNRGNIVHATNDSRVYVYEPGLYMGIAQLGADTTSVTSGGTLLTVVLKVNGVAASTFDSSRKGGNVWSAGHQFNVFLNAGDYVEIALQGTWSGTIKIPSGNHRLPRLDLWWRNN